MLWERQFISSTSPPYHFISCRSYGSGKRSPAFRPAPGNSHLSTAPNKMKAYGRRSPGGNEMEAILMLEVKAILPEH